MNLQIKIEVNSEKCDGKSYLDVEQPIQPNAKKKTQRIPRFIRDRVHAMEMLGSAKFLLSTHNTNKIIKDNLASMI